MSDLRQSRTKLRTSSLLASSGDDEGFEVDDTMGADFAAEDAAPFGFFPAAESDRRLRDVTARVASLFEIPPSSAELLLIRFKWDHERLQTVFWEDPDKHRREAGLCVGDSGAGVAPASKTPRQQECSICSTEATAWHALECRHGPFCTQCWGKHVHTRLSEGATVFRCMQRGCMLLMREEDVAKVATKEDFTKWRAAIARSFVDLSPRLCWCPNPRSCNQVVEYRGVGRPDLVVSCPCGFRFCYACRHVKHTPVPCELVRMWEEKSQDPDAQLSFDWITSNTKPCPKCNHRIQKNEGCNHMTCPCGHQFCWLCRADWSTHGSHTGGFYSCNRYDTSDAKKQDDKISATKKELDKYLHYFNRFFNYRRDLERGDEKRRLAASKVAEFKKDVSATRFGMNSAFMPEAVELELECRDVLSWTYVISYYLPDDSRQKDFFQFLQANLEGITERLADMNKSKLAEQDDDQLKTRSRVTKQYLDAMAQAMEEEARALVQSGQLQRTLRASGGAAAAAPSAAAAAPSAAH